MIQQIVDTANAILKQEKPTKQMLAVGIEINQRYTEYLDELLDGELSQPEGVTVAVDGKTIHFPTSEAFANWLAENMT